MLCSRLIFSCKLNKSLTLQLSLCVHENEDSALGEASSKTQETSKLCSEEKCHEWSGAVEGRGSYTNPFHLLIRKALLMSESSCTATSSQQELTPTGDQQHHFSQGRNLPQTFARFTNSKWKRSACQKLEGIQVPKSAVPNRALRKEDGLGWGRAALSAQPGHLGPPHVCQSWGRAAAATWVHYI